MNSDCLKLNLSYSVSYNLSNVGEILGVESEGNVPTIGDKIVKITSENKRVRTLPVPHPFQVGVFVVFYR